MRWLGFVFIAIAAAVIRPPFASAQPVRLVCEGEMQLLNVRGDATQNYTLLLAIDLGAGTVGVGSWGTSPINSKPDAGTLTFQAVPGTVGAQSTGAINRLTGKAAIGISVDGLERSFSGTCRASQRLF
jgi:hypothetical protein